MRVLFAALLLCALPAGAAKQEAFPLREDGSIIAWEVAGPLATPGIIAHSEQCAGYFTDYLKDAGGEGNAAPSAGDLVKSGDGTTVAWKTVFSAPSGLLDYSEIFGTSPAFSGVAYAFCWLQSDREQQVVLKVRSNDGVRVWLDTQLVHDHHLGRTIEQMEDTVCVTLRQGMNRLLAKVDQSGGGWGLLLRVVTPHGGAVEGVQAAVASEHPLAREIVGVTMRSTPFVRNTPEGPRQALRGLVTSGGVTDLVCRIRAEEWAEPQVVQVGDLAPGQHRIDVSIPVVTKTCSAQVSLSASGSPEVTAQIQIAPPRPWTIDLVQHVHTDIGYTRPQTEILPEHLRYIDYALDYCDLTDAYPDDAKFRWTCETTWAVREYVKRRPAQQVDRLKRRIAEGRIEVTGMFLNMAEIASETSLAASLQPLRDIEEELQAPVSVAMQDDVNGAAWCLVDYFAPVGIKYLTMGVNRTRSLLPFDRPTPFWWESPSGNRILAFRADHYHTGNSWRVHDGDVASVEEGVLKYLRQLEESEYPFDLISVQYSGYLTDNSPPSMNSSNLIRDWNARYAWPKLRSATASEFMKTIEEHHGAQLPSYRQAWPDWWTDGFGSAARETAASRKTNVAMQTNETLLAMASMFGATMPAGIGDRTQTVYEKLLFYDEHTYGAAESIDDPLVENSMVQWAEKGAYVWEAVKDAALIREEALGALQGFVPRRNTATIAVFNSLNWPRSGLIEVFIDHDILASGQQGRVLDPERGVAIPMQPLRERSEGTFWAMWVTDVPPLGFKSYRIETSNQPHAKSAAPGQDATLLENAFYRMELDAKTGGIARLLDKQSGQELVDNGADWRLGQVLHERPAGRSALDPEGIQRTPLGDVSIAPGDNGPIWKSVRVRGNLAGTDGAGGVRAEFRLYETEPRIELHFAARKLPVTGPEAIYVAFPFSLPESEVWYEAQGGMVRPGKDQIERTSSDWQTVQNFISIRGKNNQLVLGSDEAPLVQFGGLNLGKWQPVAIVQKPHVYSWVMNNYWFTNFRATQEGEFRWSYYLTSTNDVSNSAATRFGWGSRRPMIARVLPPGDERTGKDSRLALELNTPNVVLVNAHPSSDRSAVILHLRETDGKTAAIDIAGLYCASRIKSVVEVDVLGRKLGRPLKRLSLKPFESKFILIKTRFPAPT